MDVRPFAQQQSARVARRLFLAVSFVLTAAASLPAPAHAAVSNCPRPAAGSVVTPPPDLYSSKGVLTVAFNYFTARSAAGLTLFCFVTPSGIQSPTLHVKPGDTINVTLTDMLPAPPPSAPSETVSSASTQCGAATMTIASVNIHYHGTNTTPTCHSDEVIHTLVNPGQTFAYTLNIPANEPPGLYWYHPHVHGIAEGAVQGGATGLIEVEGIANFQPAVNGLPERFLVIRDQNVSNPPRKTTAVPPPAWDLTLNYVPILYPTYQPAVIQMHAGGQEFWRVANTSADTMIDLQLVYDNKAQPLELVALDGVPIGSQDGAQKGTIETQTDVLLPPASRAEFIVRGPQASVQNALLVTRAVNTGPGGDNDPLRPLATIKTTTSLSWLPRSVLRTGAANVQRFEGLAKATPTTQRTLYFSEDVTPPPKGLKGDTDTGATRFFITVDGAVPQLFNANNPPAITTTQGSVEDWTIQNHTQEVHAFHIHQIHFLLLAVNGVPVPAAQQQFYDTYPVGFYSGSGPYPSITVRMDFRGADIGDFVYHCHILEHEDGGMMAIIRVLPSAKHAANAPARHV